MDPYRILGVSSSATDDEVKRAYRNLCKKHHPDLFAGKPEEAAEEKKFLEIQEAYDTVMKMRQQGSSYDPYGGYASYGNYGGAGASSAGSGDNKYQAAANYINVGYYQQALNVLDSISARTGQWYYLSAIAHMGIGNRMTALEHARSACQMEPGNMSYQQLLSQLQSSGTFYQQTGQQWGRPTAGMDSWCMKLCLMNLLCNGCCGVRFC